VGFSVLKYDFALLEGEAGPTRLPLGVVPRLKRATGSGEGGEVARVKPGGALAGTLESVGRGEGGLEVGAVVEGCDLGVPLVEAEEFVHGVPGLDEGAEFRGVEAKLASEVEGISAREVALHASADPSRSVAHKPLSEPAIEKEGGLGERVKLAGGFRGREGENRFGMVRRKPAVKQVDGTGGLRGSGRRGGRMRRRGAGRSGRVSRGFGLGTIGGSGRESRPSDGCEILRSVRGRGRVEDLEGEFGVDGEVLGVSGGGVEVGEGVAAVVGPEA